MAAFLVYSFLLLSSVVTLSASQSSFQSSYYPSVTAAATNAVLPFDVRAWIELLRSKMSRLHSSVESPKRSCNVFPCMYTHLGAKAGRQAMMRSLMSIIHSCAHDPMCSPGKRRRRSTNNLLSILTQRKVIS